MNNFFISLLKYIGISSLISVMLLFAIFASYINIFKRKGKDDEKVD